MIRFNCQLKFIYIIILSFKNKNVNFAIINETN